MKDPKFIYISFHTFPFDFFLRPLCENALWIVLFTHKHDIYKKKERELEKKEVLFVKLYFKNIIMNIKIRQKKKRLFIFIHPKDVLWIDDFHDEQSLWWSLLFRRLKERACFAHFSIACDVSYLEWLGVKYCACDFFQICRSFLPNRLCISSSEPMKTKLKTIYQLFPNKQCKHEQQ